MARQSRAALCRSKANPKVFLRKDGIFNNPHHYRPSRTVSIGSDMGTYFQPVRMQRDTARDQIREAAFKEETNHDIAIQLQLVRFQ